MQISNEKEPNIFKGAFKVIEVLLSIINRAFEKNQDLESGMLEVLPVQEILSQEINKEIFGVLWILVNI